MFYLPLDSSNKKEIHILLFVEGLFKRFQIFEVIFQFF